MHDALIVQQPTTETQQLMLLFHGAGASAANLLPLGQGLARAFPQARVVSVQAPAGRFAAPPRNASHQTTLHLIHGQDDPVIDPGHSVDAAEILAALGARVTLDLVPALGHGVDARALEIAIERLRA